MHPFFTIYEEPHRLHFFEHHTMYRTNIPLSLPEYRIFITTDFQLNQKPTVSQTLPYKVPTSKLVGKIKFYFLPQQILL